MSAVFLVLAVLFLAYANGSNNTFKGVATLYGSGTASYRKAIAWATLTTTAGGVAALVSLFGMKGIVPDEIARSRAFVVAVAAGSALVLILATRLGLPVSTTHTLAGSLVGAGAVACGRDLGLAPLVMSFAVPLVVSPILALGGTALLSTVFGFVRRRTGIHEETCLFVGPGAFLVPVPRGTILALAPGSVVTLSADQVEKLRPLELSVGTEAVCVRRYEGRVLGVKAQGALDALHFLSSGAVGFARGLNDAPKIVALLVTGRALGVESGLSLVALAMAAGGLIHSRRIAETMGKKITSMNAGQAFTGNLVTALLVIAAALFSLPVSTTHVSCGALFGIGAVNGEARWKVVFQVLLAWIVTLPAAALLAAGAYRIARAS
ncbi:inorganic phosphate transporter [bacterium]|nr:inorganic phosphate transporter [bacterium]